MSAALEFSEGHSPGRRNLRGNENKEDVARRFHYRWQGVCVWGGRVGRQSAREAPAAVGATLLET